MIPAFDDNGYLRPGIYPATLGEVMTRFGTENDVRAAQGEGVEWLVDWCYRAAVVRLVIDGSFVTDRDEPNDVDCARLFAPGGSRDRRLMREYKHGWPYLQVRAGPIGEFNFMVELFSTDRDGAAKGMVEVLL